MNFKEITKKVKIILKRKNATASKRISKITSRCNRLFKKCIKNFTENYCKIGDHCH